MPRAALTREPGPAALDAERFDAGAGSFGDPRPVQREQGDQRVLGWSAKPGRQIVSQDSTKRRQPNRRSDRDPVPLTLAPRPVILGEAAPEALSTLSLPNRSSWRQARIPGPGKRRWSGSERRPMRER